MMPDCKRLILPAAARLFPGFAGRGSLLLRPQYFYGSEWAQSFREVVPFGSIFVGDEMEIKRMRDLREDSDQTQKAIADVLKMHRSVYRRYESGQRETPAWVIVKLADYYKVSTDYLLGRTDQRTPYPPARRK